MNLTQARKDFWVHLNPAGSDNFMVHGRTYSEPRFDKQLGHYVVSDEGRMCNDRLACVNCIAKTFLPDALWNSVTPGKRAHVYNYCFWELKDENDEISLPIAQKTDYSPDTYFEMQQFTDHLIFGLKGKAELHERYSTFNTRQDNPANPLNVQFVNKYGQVITHGCGSVIDDYVMIGCRGDVVSPFNIARLWGSEPNTKRQLDTLLIEAYTMGLRYKEPPKESTIRMNVSVISGEVIRIESLNDYYGFAENMLFCSKHDFHSDPFLGTRNLDKSITGAILAYRWFFNKPDLKVSLSLVHNEKLEAESSWKNQKDYSKYMSNVESYNKAGLAALTKRINGKVEQKWEKYKESPYFKPEDYVSTDCFSQKLCEVAE